MSVLEAIGHTPMVALNALNPNPNVRMLAKLEGNNPGGSVKDRTALYLVKEAEAAGDLKPGKVILEPTSGNTGIALAMIGVAKGYKVKLTLPGCVSNERQHILEAFGAEVIRTPACQGTDGAIRAAKQILENDPDTYYMPYQFAHPGNPKAHYETTAPEIWGQTQGEITAFVAGMGTTGTLMGVSRFMKEQDESIRIVGAEPIKGHKIQGLKNMEEAIVPEIYEPDRLDQIISVEDEPAFETTRRLAMEEGIFVGISSGAAVAAAMEVAKEMDSGTLVTLLPDRGDRYLSTTLFRSVCADCPP